MDTPTLSPFPEPPTFEYVLDRLKMPLLAVIHEALAEGTLHVSEYANWQAEPIDYALAPNLVRHKAKQFLISRGQETQDEEVDLASFETEHVPNNGLYTIVPGFRVRILKSNEDGTVPLPGTSETRRNFYNQQQAVLDFDEPTWGLIVHWTVDGAYSLLKLSVALPLGVTKTESGKSVVDCAFDEPFWIKPLQPNVIRIDDAIVPLTNLDIPIEEDTGEKTGEEPKDE